MKEKLEKNLESHTGIRLEDIMMATKQYIAHPHKEDFLEGLAFLIATAGFIFLAIRIIVN